MSSKEQEETDRQVCNVMCLLFIGRLAYFFGFDVALLWNFMFFSLEGLTSNENSHMICVRIPTFAFHVVISKNMRFYIYIGFQ